jgi:hypothetical protein
MTKRALTTFIALIFGLGLIPTGAEATPITYSFAGEMLTFIPPVTQPGVPFPPPPPDLQFFTGSFLYDPAGGLTGATTDFSLAFTDGAAYSASPTTTSTTTSQFGALNLLLVSIGIRNITPDFNGVNLLLERPQIPGDQDGVLPATLDGFDGSYFETTFLSNIFVIGSLSSFEPISVAAIDEPSPLPILLTIVLIAGCWLAVFRRRSRYRADAFMR